MGDAMTGAQLLAWRKRIGFTKGQADETLGLAPVTYRRYERGLVEIPRYIALAAAAVENGIPALGDPPPAITEAEGFDGRAEIEGDEDGFAEPFDPDPVRGRETEDYDT